MILSAQSIRARVEGKRVRPLTIRPFHTRTVENGMTFGLSACGYDVRIKDALTMLPGTFALATTIEYFEFPDDLRGTLADKSSWARRGVAVQNTRFEPGWRGYPTIEISNHGKKAVYIPEGAPIAQMEFTLLDLPTDQPYDGKYQDQRQEPVEAIDETKIQVED